MQNVFYKLFALTTLLVISLNSNAQYSFSSPWHTFTTPHGNIQLGPSNGSFAHIKTNLSKFYFNKPIWVDGGTIGTYQSDLIFHTDGTSRMTILNSNGNVGINTANNPVAHLEVEDQGEGTGTLLLRTRQETNGSAPGDGGEGTYQGGPNPTKYFMPTPVSTPYALSVEQYDIIDQQYNNTFLVYGSGLVRQGKTVNYSNAKFGISLYRNIGIFQDNNNIIKMDYNPLDGPRMIWTSDAGTPKNLSFSFSTSPTYSPSSESEVLTLNPSGKVAINTTEMPGDHTLYVGGKILAEELTVKLQQDWPDYVFNSDYTRMSLLETEKFINDNGHLPGVPSAEEVKKNGVNVGEMEAILLEKIEELTLEVIRLNSKLEAIESQK